MLFYHDTVTGIQFLGFSIALGGLAYYQLGGAPAMRGYYGQAVSKFSEYRRLSGEIDVVSAVEMAQEGGKPARKSEESKSPGIVNIKNA